MSFIEETDDERVREIYLKANIDVGTSKTQIDRVLKTNLATPFQSFGNSPNKRMFVIGDRTTTTGLVGILTATKNEKTGVYELDNLAIDPKFQRQGFATRLIEMAWKHTRPFQLSAIGSNTASLAFYDQCPLLELKEVTKHYSENDHIHYTLHHYRSVDTPKVTSIVE